MADASLKGFDYFVLVRNLIGQIPPVIRGTG
jgi:hypothetical protein